MSRFSYLVMVLVLFPLGLEKKTNKFTGSSNDAASTSTPPPVTGDKGKKDGDKAKKDGEKANWLNGSNFQKDNNTVSGGGTQAESLPGKPGWGIPKPEGGWTSQNSQPGIVNPSGTPGSPMKLPVAGGSGGAAPNAGATQPTVAPTTTATKPVSEADMKDIWIFIDARSGASGQMPAPKDVYAALIAAKSPAADLARGGSIVLTGSRVRESIWAYEAKAITQGGLVATQNGVENLTAVELTRRLAGR